MCTLLSLHKKKSPNNICVGSHTQKYAKYQDLNFSHQLFVANSCTWTLTTHLFRDLRRIQTGPTKSVSIMTRLVFVLLDTQKTKQFVLCVHCLLVSLTCWHTYCWVAQSQPVHYDTVCMLAALTRHTTHPTIALCDVYWWVAQSHLTLYTIPHGVGRSTQWPHPSLQVAIASENMVST
jgi:hypothetical protein